MKTQFSEAIKLKDGVVYNLPYHQARINYTQVKFGGEKFDLTEVLSEIPPYYRKGIYKCRIVYSKNVENIEFIPYSFRQIKNVGVVHDNEIEYGYKYTDRSHLNKLLQQTGCDDIIIIKQGFVTDAFSSNLVFESDEGLFTPNTCLLPGTKRQFLVDTGKIREKQITVNDIQSFNRVRFINAMIDIEDNIFVDTVSIIR